MPVVDCLYPLSLALTAILRIVGDRLHAFSARSVQGLLPAEDW
jgi:hypothetical protein